MQKIFYKNEKITTNKNDTIFQINRTKDNVNGTFYYKISNKQTIKKFFKLLNIKVDNNLNIK